MAFKKRFLFQALDFNKQTVIFVVYQFAVVCQLITEPQCHMLPYNQTWLTSSVAVVKSSEVDMLLRYMLSRMSRL